MLKPPSPAPPSCSTALRPGRGLGPPARLVQKQIIDKKLKFYVIDGYEVAKETGMGGRINTIMQTCFFAISGVLPREEAIAAIKHAIKKTYGKRGEAWCRRTSPPWTRPWPPARSQGSRQGHSARSTCARRSRRGARVRAERAGPDHRRQRRRPAGERHAVDGTFPTATTQWEKRNIALEIPEWDEELCIQCGKCVLVCPHAVIRAKVYDDSYLAGAPATFKSDAKARWKDMKDRSTPCRWRPRIAPAAAVRRGLPGQDKSEVKHKAINMVAAAALRESEAANWEFFLKPPRTDRKLLSPGPGEGRAVAPAAVRVLRRLLRLRRNALRQADDPALRRPRHDRQRHRLLLHLRRQPAHHALLRQPEGRGPPGPTRCSKTTPSSAWACAWPSTSRTSTPASWSGGWRADRRGTWRRPS
jgi:ferredoxin